MKQIDWRESKMLPPVTSCCFRANTNVSSPLLHLFSYLISKHWCSFHEHLLDCFRFVLNPCFNKVLTCLMQVVNWVDRVCVETLHQVFQVTETPLAASAATTALL